MLGRSILDFRVVQEFFRLHATVSIGKESYESAFKVLLIERIVLDTFKSWALLILLLTERVITPAKIPIMTMTTRSSIKVNYLVFILILYIKIKIFKS